MQNDKVFNYYYLSKEFTFYIQILMNFNKWMIIERKLHFKGVVKDVLSNEHNCIQMNMFWTQSFISNI